MVKATVITIGDEILIGQIVDTNSAWLGQQFSGLGVKLHEIISVGDDAAQIIDALNRAKVSSQIILMTGGLGPTKDDITKKTLVEYFNTTLELNEEVWEKMKQIFEKRGAKVLEINRSQAMIPKDCIMLPNTRGTAQGMWFERDGLVFISMPGVPHEMKIFPSFSNNIPGAVPLSFFRTVHTSGTSACFLLRSNNGMGRLNTCSNK